MSSLRERIQALDWKTIERSLDAHGYATTPAVLSSSECKELVALYDDDERFRSRIDMARYRFGVGDYAYFAHPLPSLVRELRVHAYRKLAPIASRWARALRRDAFPRSLRAFLQHCHARGQKRPTPLLLRYTAGGYNCLHQDLYGGVVFPLQLTVFLSQPGIDYGGGEFLLVEQRPRVQSRGMAVRGGLGELVIFPCAERPTAGQRGTVRVTMRHGASPLAWGSRYALGVIFHDAR